MTPSEERKFKKDIKDLFAQNDERDAAMAREIADLKARMKTLEGGMQEMEDAFKPTSVVPPEHAEPKPGKKPGKK